MIYSGECTRGDSCWHGSSFYEARIDLGQTVNAKSTRVTVRGHVFYGGHSEIRIQCRWFENGTLGKIDDDWRQPPDVDIVTVLTEQWTGRYVGFLGLPPGLDPSWHVDLDYIKVEVSDTGELPPIDLYYGLRFCMDGNLYEVEADGTSWHLVQSNAPLCVTTGGCPDFWSDPVGAVICWVITAIEQALGFVSGGFLTLLANINSLLTNFGADIATFFSDPVTKITNWMGSTWTTIAEVTAGITAGITAWWQQEVVNVGVMITNATANFSNWIDSSYTNIADWWDDTKDTVGSWLAAQWTNINDFWTDITINISNWYDSNIYPILLAIGEKINDFSTWVITGYDSLGEWWNDRITDIQDWIADAYTGFNDWIDTSYTDIGDWWNSQMTDLNTWWSDRVTDLNNWVNNTLPGIVEGMFDWAKPIINPIIAAAGWLESLTDVFTAKAVDDPDLKADIDTIQSKRDEIDIVIGRIP